MCRFHRRNDADDKARKKAKKDAEEAERRRLQAEADMAERLRVREEQMAERAREEAALVEAERQALMSILVAVRGAMVELMGTWNSPEEFGEKVDELFETINVVGDGEVTIEQLDKGLRAREVALPNSELKAIIEIYDLDRNEALNRAEFTEMVTVLTNKKQEKEVADGDDGSMGSRTSSSAPSSPSKVSRVTSTSSVKASSRGSRRGEAEEEEVVGFARRPASRASSSRRSARRTFTPDGHGAEGASLPSRPGTGRPGTATSETGLSPSVVTSPALTPLGTPKAAEGTPKGFHGAPRGASARGATAERPGGLLQTAIQEDGEAEELSQERQGLDEEGLETRGLEGGADVLTVGI